MIPPLGPIIDAYCCVGPYSKRQLVTPFKTQDLLQEHARYGIQHRLCLHAESREGVAQEGNQEMSRLAGKHPGTGVIWTALPSRRFRAEPVDTLMARAQEAGVAMFAMFPERQNHFLAPWANGELYASMEEARLPLLLETGHGELDHTYTLAQAHPRMPIVFWNVSYMHVRRIVALMDLCPNVHVGLAPNFVPNDGIEMFTERYGSGRLIFGSHWPHQSPGSLIGYVTYADVGDDIKRAVFGGNVAQLLHQVFWPVQGFEEEGE